jgi:CRP/FNR family transcriptional regulator
MGPNSDRLDIHNSEVPLVCRSCEARHRGICGALDPRELTELASHTRRVHHEHGEELLEEAGEITAYATIIRGVVRLVKSLADGRRQLVGLQFAPDFLGRLFGKQNSVTAESVGPVDLCTIPRRALERMVTNYPTLGQRITSQVLRELDEARDWLVTVGQKSAPEKVASLLLLISTQADVSATDDDKNSVVFYLPLSRADIADYLGLTIETVSRQFTKLRTSGVIRVVNGRHVEVPDLSRLRELSG